MNAVQFLKKVKAQIPTSDQWTQGALFRDRKGEQIELSDARIDFGSIRMSLRGATQIVEFIYVARKSNGNIVDRASRETYAAAKVARKALHRICHEQHGYNLYNLNSIAEFNDRASTSHADIIKLIDDAIDLLYRGL